jgi:hypothetical protein
VLGQALDLAPVGRLPIASNTARSLTSEVVSPVSILTRTSSGISEPDAQIEPTRSTGDRVLEKLPMRITRRRPSIAASEASPGAASSR